MDPLYDYISEIANRMYPTWEFDDSCGEYFQTDSFRGWDFVHQLEDGRLKSPFTKEQYLENAPIIRSLRAMGIDTEKFWMAMLFVYDVVREQTENVQQVPASVFEDFRALAKYLQVTRLRLPSNVFCRFWKSSKRKIAAVRIPIRFPITECC